MLRHAGVVAVDAGLLGGAPRATIDALGEVWDSGAGVLLGLVPALEPAVPPILHELAREMLGRLAVAGLIVP